ncbi:Aminopeptidase YwaD (Arginyl aminopeptidase) (BSAP) (Leucyl aminopeptidase) [Durusdinium trenchii]|uniref:Aminopeptidase YwaD (Arginyl aminopeptidase) (BSAP) (Leucyl aminopeptidase) n=1 Tax=Durusdinium trenchii TaxID=1381693 RepID=A0ABP0JGX6_9DINO
MMRFEGGETERGDGERRDSFGWTVLDGLLDFFLAGINGLMKCVLMGCFAVSAPNIHLRLLNPHIDDAAYPVYFTPEFVDQGKDDRDPMTLVFLSASPDDVCAAMSSRKELSTFVPKETGFFGVSSFGFGGSNARGDIWCRAQAGHRNTAHDRSSMSFGCDRIFRCIEAFGSLTMPLPGVDPFETEHGDSTEGLSGEYTVGAKLQGKTEYFVVSSANGWSYGKMTWDPSSKSHCYAIMMGEALCEQFQISCDGFDDLKIFPATQLADEQAVVLGPGIAPSACWEGFQYEECCGPWFGPYGNASCWDQTFTPQRCCGEEYAEKTLHKEPCQCCNRTHELAIPKFWSISASAQKEGVPIFFDALTPWAEWLRKVYPKWEPDTFEVFRSNMEMQIENSGDSEDKLHLGPPRPRRHRRHRRKLGHVKARTIEDLQDEMPGIREVSFVKIDTEGHEEVIVPALESFFRQKRPTVLVSLHPMFLGHRRVQKVVQLLQRIFPKNDTDAIFGVSHSWDGAEKKTRWWNGARPESTVEIAVLQPRLWGHTWLIDGRKDKVKPHALYRISLQWNEELRKKRPGKKLTAQMVQMAQMETPLARRMRQNIRFLADDALKGRKPGTFGEEVAAAFVASEMEEIGCLPAGEDGTYFQTVKMVGLTVKEETSRLGFKVKDFQITGTFGDDYVHSMDPTDCGESEILSSLESDLVFVGHGVKAPELSWDDFKEQSMVGKVILVLVNQPQVPPFPSDDMLYYGRWSYKLEEARRRGAAGCLIIHFREKLAEAFGGTLQSWCTEASKSDFQPFTVGRISHEVEYQLRRFQGRNVLGLISGNVAPREVVVIAGHHDHLGEQGNEIYNGAVDNCTGVAMMLATARLLKDISLGRSVLFMAPTAEECGMLGSEFYAQHPLVGGQLIQPIAAFAFDVGNVWGKTADLAILGFGKSTLDPLLMEAAESQKLRIIPDQQPKMGLFYRSDHWSFVRHGVPGCWFFFGHDFIGRPATYYEEVIGRYIKTEYYKPADTYKEHWSMEGLLSQVEYTVAVVKLLSSRTDFIPRSLNRRRRTLRLCQVRTTLGGCSPLRWCPCARGSSTNPP